MFQSSASDSSDCCERFKNVRSLHVKSKESQRDLDENYAYKQRLGDLVFNADFEGGNLGNVEQVDQYDYDLMVRPDVTNPRHRVWFNFTVNNQRPNQCVIFTFVNLSEKLSLFDEGLTPVVRSQHQPNWIRLRWNQVFHYRSSNHNNRRVLSLAFRFKTHDDEHQFALFYPYTITTLTEFIDRWTVELKRRARNISHNVCALDSGAIISPSSTRLDLGPTDGGSGALASTHDKESHSQSKIMARPVKVGNSRRNWVDFGVNILTRSVLFKPVYMLSISSPAAITRDRLTAIVIGRSSGNFESASSFVCQGLLDFMLSDDPVAATAREYVNLVVFPMLDPDSSWVGNGRSDIMGQSSISAKLISANPSLYENYRLASEKIDTICAGAKSRVVIIELRVSSNLVGSRIIGSLYADSLRMERHMHLPRLLSRFSEAFYLERCEFVDSSKRPPRESELFGITNVDRLENYQLEVGPSGYHKRTLLNNEREQFDQKKYLLLGRSIAHSLLELNRPKCRELQQDVARHLASFHPSSNDIDDLMLVHVNKD